MNLGDLKNIVRGWNDEWLRSICERNPSEATDIYLDQGVAVIRGLRPCDKCYCGHFTGKGYFPDEITHPDGRSVAVGAVVDNQTVDKDLPVILAVGISYWQFGETPSAWPVLDWESTRMRTRLDSALEKVRSCWHPPREPHPYHMVAVNFFPWVTRSPWSDVPSSLSEALALQCWGAPDTGAQIFRLIARLAERRPGSSDCHGDLELVCFHGVNNAVPALSVGLIDSIQRGVHTNVMYSDNLGYSAPPRNAIVLHPALPLCVRRGWTNKVQDE